MNKNICSISIDVDNLMDYIKAYHWDEIKVTSNDSIYEIALPRMLELFSRFEIKATFFVVGRDINQKNKSVLREILAEGHEIGNHSMNHLFHMPSLLLRQKKEEIIMMQRSAEDILGYRPMGFRAPGNNIDRDTLQILEEEGYIYDSSIYPSCWQFFLKLFGVFFASRGRQKWYIKGKIDYCFSPRRPYFLQEYFSKKEMVGLNSRLIEIPISVVPLLRIPFHGTFILISPKWFFDLGYSFIKNDRCNINYGMHAIEMLNAKENDLNLIFLRQPGLNIASIKKMKRYDYILTQIKKDFDFMTLLDFIRRYKWVN